jgi:hypothetical protein
VFLSEVENVLIYWTLTSAVLLGGPRAKGDTNSSVCVLLSIVSAVLLRDVRSRRLPNVVSKLCTPKKKVRGRGRKKRVTAIEVRNAMLEPCSLSTVRRALKGMNTTKRRNRSEAVPLSQEQEQRMNRSRNLQGW